MKSGKSNNPPKENLFSNLHPSMVDESLPVKTPQRSSRRRSTSELLL